MIDCVERFCPVRSDLRSDRFEHIALDNPNRTRIEIYVHSLYERKITIGGDTSELSAGELIRTEYSHKYTSDGFAGTAAGPGFTLSRHRTDERSYFAVLHLAVADRRLTEDRG